MESGKRTEQDVLWMTGMEAVYLAACALHGQSPVWDASKDLSALYKFCKKHSMAAIVAMALEDFWKENPPEDPEQMKPWKQAKDQAIRKNILLNAERERILQYLESIGCWYMPLKGSLLQYDYPKFGMRQMSDNDILYDREKQNAVREFMRESQYKRINEEVENHDEYIKPPVYNFEMHVGLVRDKFFPALSEYYSNVKQIMIKDDGNQYGYHLSDNDFYIFMEAHAHKHFYESGTGVRNLMDTYVYLRAHGDNLNWDYIEKELRSIDVWDFDCKCRQLSKKLFGCPGQELQFSQEELEFLDEFLQSGTHGTQKQRVRNELEKIQQDGNGNGKSTKLRYIFKRLFPSVGKLSIWEHDLEQRKWKIPFVVLKRLCRAVFVHPLKTIREIRALIKAK